MVSAIEPDLYGLLQFSIYMGAVKVLALGLITQQRWHWAIEGIGDGTHQFSLGGIDAAVVGDAGGHGFEQAWLLQG
ncbi:MAG: hypothetical protein ACI9EB_001350 [Pseudomonas sp.]